MKKSPFKSKSDRWIRSVAAYWPLHRFICWHGPRTGSKVALTFDDGPRTDTTDRILTILHDAGICGTFFLEGRWIEKRPDLVRKIVEGGHEIGNHAYQHGQPDLCRQIRQCDKLLMKLEIRTRWIRPPLGRISVMNCLRLVGCGHRIAFWSFDTHDSMRHEGKWPGADPDYGEIEPGDIVLMHDDNPLCIQELPGLIKDLRARNLCPVTLSELMK